MVKHSGLGLVFCLLAFASNAQLLWQVRADKEAKPSYLFGTVHMGVAISAFDKTLIEKLNSCDAVATEINTDSLNPLSVMHLMLMPDSVSYSDYLSKDEYYLVDSAMKAKLGVGLAAMKRLLPIINVISLSLDEAALTKDQTAANPLDLSLRDTSHSLGKEVLALETAEQQMRLLVDLPLEKQFEMLLQTAKDENGSYGETELKDIFELYYNQDLEGFVALFKSGEYDDKWTAGLLDNRNIEMVKNIKLIMQEKTVFVAVGAGHLGGEFGLVQLLKNEGYLLEPIDLKFVKDE